MAAPILNLGCGNEIIGGAVNHDVVKHRPEVDVVWNLNDLPWPWPDSTFRLVVAKSVLEHLKLNLVESLNEVWRILRPGGQLYVKLPYWNSAISHDDPTHRWFFNYDSLDQFDPTTKRGQQYAFYTPRKWKITERPALNNSQSSLAARMVTIK